MGFCNLCYITGFEKVALNHSDYETVISRLVKLNLTGGAIYDALIAQAALVAEVDTLLTANPKDFLRLGEDVGLFLATEKFWSLRLKSFYLKDFRKYFLGKGLLITTEKFCCLTRDR